MIAHALSIGFVVFACSSAFAQSVPQSWDWSGPYVGFQINATDIKTGFSSGLGVLPSGDYKDRPLTGGIHGGYGNMVGPFYLAIEADIEGFGEAGNEDAAAFTSYSGGDGGALVGSAGGSAVGAVTGAASGGSVYLGNGIWRDSNGRLYRMDPTPGPQAPGTASPQGLNGASTTSVEAFATELNARAALRARMGYPVGRFLPFVSGGVAVANVTTSHVLGVVTETLRGGAVTGQSIRAETTTVRGYDVGYTIGGGMEIALTPRIALRAEYLFTDLGDRNFSLADGSDVSFDTTVQDVRLGVTFRF